MSKSNIHCVPLSIKVCLNKNKLKCICVRDNAISWKIQKFMLMCPKKKKERKNMLNKQNTYTKIMHNKYYHVILLKHGKLFNSDIHIILLRVNDTTQN